MSLSADTSAWGDTVITKAPPAPVDSFVDGKVEESAPDADGIITITEYRRDPQSGAKQKVTRKVRRVVREVRIPEAVRLRSEWKAFGEAAKSNDGTSLRSFDDVHFEKPGEADRVKDDLEKLQEKQSSIIVCRKCGKVGDHYTLKCPYADLDLTGGGGSGAGAGGPDELSGKYVPPALRAGGGGAGGSAAAAEAALPTEELRRLRIGNLAEDVEEDEVRDLAAPFGRVEKVSLARHKESGKVSAAYVTFGYHEEAERARKALDGYGFRYLVLKVDWAKPNPMRDNFAGSAGLSGGFVSGYGKALPQSRPGGGH